MNRFRFLAFFVSLFLPVLFGCKSEIVDPIQNRINIFTCSASDFDQLDRIVRKALQKNENKLYTEDRDVIALFKSLNESIAAKCPREVLTQCVPGNEVAKEIRAEVRLSNGEPEAYLAGPLIALGFHVKTKKEGASFVHVPHNPYVHLGRKADYERGLACFREVTRVEGGLAYERPLTDWMLEQLGKKPNLVLKVSATVKEIHDNVAFFQSGQIDPFKLNKDEARCEIRLGANSEPGDFFGTKILLPGRYRVNKHSFSEGRLRLEMQENEAIAVVECLFPRGYTPSLRDLETIFGPPQNELSPFAEDWGRQSVIRLFEFGPIQK